MPTAPRLPVVVATDAAFALPTAVTLRSLVLATPDVCDITVLHAAVPTEIRQQVEASLPAGGHSVSWIDCSQADVGYDRPGYLPAAAYFRLRAPELLPGVDGWLLYIDVDTLIVDSIAPLWDVDLGDAVVGAVRSVNYPAVGTWGSVDNWRELDLDPRAPYFNSGVMFINTSRWRDQELTTRTMDCLRSPLVSRRTADQESLNVALAGRWIELDPRWNQQPPLLHDCRGAHLLYSDEVLEAARTHPAIIHFSDRPKPWHTDCEHPARDRWRRMAGRTAFAPIELDRTPVTETIRWRVKRAASALLKGR